MVFILVASAFVAVVGTVIDAIGVPNMHTELCGNVTIFLMIILDKTPMCRKPQLGLKELQTADSCPKPAFSAHSQILPQFADCSHMWLCVLPWTSPL